MVSVINGRQLLVGLLAVVFLACGVQAGESPPALVMARPTWDTGWFQAEVVKALLTELGYEVIGPQTMENAEFYDAVQDGSVDFWASGWLPLHETYFDSSAESLARAVVIGELIPETAIQGYLIDRRTAEAHGIRWLTDLQRPEIAELFDHTGDGRADLIGCNVGWGCAETIEQHLSRHGLHDTVNHVQGDYSPLMGNLLQRFQQGKPVLFYTWTPNWTIGALPPGDAVQWLQLPPDKTPESQAVPGFDHIEGCPDTPCHLGWPATDIRVVANVETLGLLSAASNLLASIQIPAQDIHAQNARMYGGEDTQADIRRHAEEWVAI